MPETLEERLARLRGRAQGPTLAASSEDPPSVEERLRRLRAGQSSVERRPDFSHVESGSSSTVPTEHPAARFARRLGQAYVGTMDYVARGVQEGTDMVAEQVRDIQRPGGV